jgi:hypothetical protein
MSRDGEYVSVSLSNTGQTVQGWSADDVTDDDGPDQDDGNAYRSVECLACMRVHLINLKTERC